MATDVPAFREKSLWSTPIRDLKLTIEGTRLEPIVAEFQKELREAGITRVQPRFYLSTEWGVPFDTIAIAIPFYLARPDLVALHEEKVGHIEGFNRSDILRYLRHEMGHVINYAYQLYNEAEWVKLFGSISQPYEEEYRPLPFSHRFVRHLPGWYSQKHPDEDWAETFAVWMTPKRDWKKDYAGWPTALAKLEYCDRCMAMVRERDPIVIDTELDEDVGELEASLEKFYSSQETGQSEPLPGIDGALQSVFEEPEISDHEPPQPDRAVASALIQRLQAEITATVYRWTGHFPERTRPLLRHLAERANALQLGYLKDQEAHVIVGLTALVTALAMNYVLHGRYTP
ncbi:MAG: hypothetical protein ACJ8FY_21710 [Gemmataceae bacterium]